MISKKGGSKKIEGNNSTKPYEKSSEKVMLVLTTLSVLFAGIAIIVSIVSWNISDTSARNLANYTMEKQLSFDKRTTAIQFYNEINNMNYSLNNYAGQYFNNFDLVTDGNNVVVDPNRHTILEIESMNSTEDAPYMVELQNGGFFIKQMDVIPLRVNGSIVKMTLPLFTDENTTIIQCRLDNPIVPFSLYNEHGIYYAYMAELTNFDSNLSNDLFSFYYKITSAEADREYIKNYFDAHPESESLDGPYFAAYMDMRMRIMGAASLMPKVLKELQEEMDK